MALRSITPSGGRTANRYIARHHEATSQEQSHAKAQAFNKLMAKSVLSLSQRVRELEGAHFDTFVIAADSKVATRVTSAGAKYAHAVRAEGTQHEYGPPHPWKFEALMAALVEDYDKSTVGDNNFDENALQKANKS